MTQENLKQEFDTYLVRMDQQMCSIDMFYRKNVFEEAVEQYQKFLPLLCDDDWGKEVFESFEQELKFDRMFSRFLFGLVRYHRARNHEQKVLIEPDPNKGFFHRLKTKFNRQYKTEKQYPHQAIKGLESVVDALRGADKLNDFVYQQWGKNIATDKALKKYRGQNVLNIGLLGLEIRLVYFAYQDYLEMVGRIDLQSKPKTNLTPTCSSC